MLSRAFGFIHNKLSSGFFHSVGKVTGPEWYNSNQIYGVCSGVLNRQETLIKFQGQ